MPRPGKEIDTGKAAAPPATDAELQAALHALADGDLAALDRIWTLCADDLYGLAFWIRFSDKDAATCLAAGEILK